MLSKFSQQEINNQPDPAMKVLMQNFNKYYDTLRVPVEMAIGGTKIRSCVGDATKLRTKLGTAAGAEHASLLIEFGVYAQAVRMRMRGQVYQSNPANLQQGLYGPDLVDKVIRENIGALYTEQGYKNAFFGAPFTGLRHDNCPEVLRLS